MSAILTASDRAKLANAGLIVSPGQPRNLVDDRRLLWQAAVRKARAAFDELRHAEKSYLAALEREVIAKRHMPAGANAYPSA